MGPAHILDTLMSPESDRTVLCFSGSDLTHHGLYPQGTCPWHWGFLLKLRKSDNVLLPKKAGEGGMKKDVKRFFWIKFPGVTLDPVLGQTDK